MSNKLISKLFSNNNNFSQLFCDCKVKLKNEDILLLFKLISQKKQYRNKFGNVFFPKKVKDIILLKAFPILYDNELYKDDIDFCSEHEMKYLFNLILFYKNKINFFCIMRNEFEKAIMYSKYDEAENILKEVNDKIGYSFWYIEAKLLLLEVTKGSLFSGEFCRELEIPDELSIIKIYTYILRDKVSLDINQRLFDERFEENCNELVEQNKSNLENCLMDYYKFSCYERIDINKCLLRNLIAVMSHLPLVDTYVLLEKIISRIVSVDICNKKEISLSDNIMKLIEKMSEGIGWIGWNNILVLTGKNESIIMNEEKQDVHKALKLFCEDKKDECSDYCISKLEKYSNNLSFMNLIAKCNIFVPDVMCGKIINIFRQLYLKDQDNYTFNSLITDCNIYIRFLSFFSFGEGFSALLRQEIESHIPSHKEQYIISLINYNFTPSKLVFYLPKKNRSEFLDIYRLNFKKLYFCDWQMSIYEELRSDLAKNFIMDSVSKNIIELFKRDNYIIINTYKYCNIESKDLVDRVYNSILFKRLFDIYVEKKEYLSAINIYLDAFFVSKLMVRKIDFKFLNHKLTFAVREALESNIEYCVYIDITKFGINCNESMSEDVMNSFKMVLRRKKVDRPSNIVWPDNPREKHLVAYFWFNICLRDVIGRLLPPFYIKQDIDDERLNIIEKLLHNYEEIGDKRDLSYLIDEKNKIIEERELDNINNCLNRGKINVSTISLKNETNDALVLAVDRGVNYKAVSNYGKVNEEIFSEFIETFAVVKKNYALEVDRILSVNIRHGILENEIIRYLKKKGLCSHYEDREVDKKNLKIFYNGIYNFIENLNEEYIWVSYKNISKGIALFFDKRLLYENIYRLKKVKTPDDLKKVCIEILNQKLKKELKRLGEVVYDKLYIGINKLLDECLLIKSSGYINQANQCKDALEYELCKIQDWFAFSQDLAEKYKFNAWIEQLKEDYPYIYIKSNSPDSFMLNSSRLNDMDILFHNLILNIFKHSGFDEDDTLLNVTVMINYKKLNDLNILKLCLSNTVSSSKKKDDILSDIERINMLINQKEGDSSSFGDRKSGYKKIIRLLNRNYGDKWNLYPDYNEKSRIFTVKLFIKYEENDEKSIDNR